VEAPSGKNPEEVTDTTHRCHPRNRLHHWDDGLLHIVPALHSPEKELKCTVLVFFGGIAEGQLLPYLLRLRTETEAPLSS